MQSHRRNLPGLLGVVGGSTPHRFLPKPGVAPLFFHQEASLSEKGFSLLEMLAAAIIMTIIVGSAVYYLSLSGSRGQAIYSTLSEVAQAGQNFANNTGCYPSNIASMGIPGANGQAVGFNNCTVNQNQWDGPYITQDDLLSDGNLPVPTSNSGESGTEAAIESGTWLSQNPEMAGRGAVELAVVIGPISPSVIASVCKICDGCSENGNNLPSTCFVTGNSVGKVFASVQ